MKHKEASKRSERAFFLEVSERNERGHFGNERAFFGLAILGLVHLDIRPTVIRVNYQFDRAKFRSLWYFGPK